MLSNKYKACLQIVYACCRIITNTIACSIKVDRKDTEEKEQMILAKLLFFLDKNKNVPKTKRNSYY